ncbi:MAG: hypothetical protein PW735_05700 [Acidobacteriaceae bacterium]|nr:hypothetical protein [Acidobacteriaceae bacterium]
MNFNNATTDVPVGKATPARKSNQAGKDIHDNARKTLDNVAMRGAQKAQDRIHKNENTNSSNTLFSK